MASLPELYTDLETRKEYFVQIYPEYIRIRDNEDDSIANCVTSSIECYTLEGALCDALTRIAGINIKYEGHVTR